MRNLDLDWVIYRSGDTLAADYATTTSCTDELVALAEEVENVCRSFYSVTEPLTRGVSAHMFWLARSLPGYLVMMEVCRVEAPGARAALEFVALVLTEPQYDEFGRNPHQIFARGLFDKARQAYHQAELMKVNVSDLSTIPPLDAPAPDHAAELRDGGEYSWSEEIVADLHRFVSNEAPAPTFASWWPASREVPEDLFRVVLRSSGHVADAIRTEPTTLPELVSACVRRVLETDAVNHLATYATIAASLSSAERSAGRTYQLVQRVQRAEGADSATETQQKVLEGATECSRFLRESADMVANVYPEGANELTELAGRMEQLGSQSRPDRAAIRTMPAMRPASPSAMPSSGRPAMPAKTVVTSVVGVLLGAAGIYAIVNSIPGCHPKKAGTKSHTVQAPTTPQPAAAESHGSVSVPHGLNPQVKTADSTDRDTNTDGATATSATQRNSTGAQTQAKQSKTTLQGDSKKKADGE